MVEEAEQLGRGIGGVPICRGGRLERAAPIPVVVDVGLGLGLFRGLLRRIGNRVLDMAAAFLFR